MNRRHDGILRVLLKRFPSTIIKHWNKTFSIPREPKSLRPGTASVKIPNGYSDINMVTHGAVLNPRPGGTILSVFQWSWVPDGTGLPTPLFIWQPTLSFLRSKGVWRGVRAKIRSEEKSKAAGFSLFKWQFSLLWCLRYCASPTPTLGCRQRPS